MNSNCCASSITRNASMISSPTLQICLDLSLGQYAISKPEFFSFLLSANLCMVIQTASNISSGKDFNDKRRRFPTLIFHQTPIISSELISATNILVGIILLETQLSIKLVLGEYCRCPLVPFQRFSHSASSHLTYDKRLGAITDTDQ